MQKYYSHDGIDVNVPVNSGVTSLDAYKIVTVNADGEIATDGSKTNGLTMITQEPYSATTTPNNVVRCRVWGVSMVRLDSAATAGSLIGYTGANATTGQRVVGYCLAPGSAANSCGVVRIIQGELTAP